MKTSSVVAAIAAVGLATSGLLYLSQRNGEPPARAGNDPSRPESTAAATPEYVLTATVVFDGVTEGCAGEEMSVVVRDRGRTVASNRAYTQMDGFDCIMAIELPVPRLKCYRLGIDGVPVGIYGFSTLRAQDFDVGYINSESIWGNVYNDYDPPPFGDRNIPCKG